MIKTVKQTIDGCEVSVTQLPYTQAQELGIGLLRDLGPIGTDFLFHVEGAQEKLSQTIRELTGALTHQRLLDLGRELLQNATLKPPGKDAKAVPFMDASNNLNIDGVMALDGVNSIVYFKTLIFALKVNYQDFLVGPALRAALDKVKAHVKESLEKDKKKSPAPSTPQSSPDGTLGS